MQGTLMLWLPCGTLRLRSPYAGYAKTEVTTCVDAKIEVTMCRVCSYCAYDVRGMLRLRLSYACFASIEVTIAEYAKIEVTIAEYAQTEVAMCRAR